MNVDCMLIGGPLNGKRLYVDEANSKKQVLRIAYRDGWGQATDELYELANAGLGFRYYVGSESAHTAPPKPDPNAWRGRS